MPPIPRNTCTQVLGVRLGWFSPVTNIGRHVAGSLWGLLKNFAQSLSILSVGIAKLALRGVASYKSICLLQDFVNFGTVFAMELPSFL